MTFPVATTGWGMAGGKKETHVLKEGPHLRTYVDLQGQETKG